MIGKTLGTFECTALLGKGGMGEVYRAKDQKLGRDVAIKVLPEDLAKDAERVARFQREAKLLASLNHSNIAAIYGLEESEGTHFLVLELIEGDTLADRLKRGAIPVEESLKLALQIAEALEAAHEKGVIHRDLKPANIKVTPDGKVKVLDFGLAKAFAGNVENMDLSNSPTLSAAATQQGVILGTAAYMSPEQASGETVDNKTDVWAFGVVLYEMLAGRSLFVGDNVSQTLARVLERQPDFAALPPNLHARIRFLLERCLEKEIKNRYHDIADIRAEIQKVLADPSGVFAQPVTAAKPQKKMRLGIPWVAAALVLGGIIAGIAVWKLKPEEARPVHRFYYDLPEDQVFSSLGRPAVAVSADGTRIVYAANGQLFLKNSDELSARPIQGTNEDPLNPFFSPDGQWIGYFDLPNKQLKKVPVGGGTSVKLCEINDPYGASWGADDRIVFGEPDGIMQISPNRGKPENIVTGEGNLRYGHPQFLPDGKTVLYFTHGRSGFQVAVHSLESGERINLFAGASARYISTGHIVYALENSLFAVSFDCDALKVTGEHVLLADNVYRWFSQTPAHFAVSDMGTLVYLPGKTGLNATIDSTLVWVDRQGREESLDAAPGAYRHPRISPDGAKVALTMHDGDKFDIWVWDTVNENMPILTSDGESSDPVWSLDGERIAFTSRNENEGGAAIYWKDANGTGEAELLGSYTDRETYPWAWSADGKTLITLDIFGGDFDIGSLSMEGERTHKPILQDEFREFQSKISPDGKWMAYTSDETGENRIYVRPFPDVNAGKWQVSTEGCHSPLWSPDGRELFYRKDNEVIAVSVERGAEFKYGKREVLFSGNYFGLIQNDSHTWDIHPDGKRFLMMKPAGDETDAAAAIIPRKINIVLNCFEELTERAPKE